MANNKKKKAYEVTVFFTDITYQIFAENETEAKRKAFARAERRKPKIDKKETQVLDYGGY